MHIVSVLRLPASLEGLAAVYPWLDHAAAACVAADRLPGMQVVLEEAVANIVLHGFPDRAPGDVEIQLCADDDAVLLVIEDDGVAFDPTAAPLRPIAANLAEAVPGGRGLTLIRRFCPSVVYARQDGRNRLTLRFPRDRPDRSA